MRETLNTNKLKANTTTTYPISIRGKTRDDIKLSGISYKKFDVYFRPPKRTFKNIRPYNTLEVTDCGRVEYPKLLRFKHCKRVNPLSKIHIIKH